MEIHVDFTNNHFEMSFIPVDFYSLESTFGHLPIHQIKNLNLGFFPDDDNPQKDCYYDNKDIYKIFPHSAADLKPLYAEMCRRFLADAEDFSEENLKRAGIVRRFENLKMEKCLSEITELIREEMTSL
jgi:hypothetical protein